MKKKLEVVSVRLVKDRPLMSEQTINSPEDAVRILGAHLCEMDREVICVINLRTDNAPINCNFVSTGSLNECLAHPRELFKSSILSNAASMLILHNHPSGVLKPSSNDTMITDKMLRLCDLLGIPLLDHIIVGGDNQSYFSFREKGIVDYPPIKMETDYNKIQSERFAVAEASKGVGDETESTEIKAAPRRRRR